MEKTHFEAVPEKETPKIHIFFRHGKRAFRLYAAVDPKKFSKGSIDHDLHFLPLLCKAREDVQKFAAFFQRNFAPTLDIPRQISYNLPVLIRFLSYPHYTFGRFLGSGCRIFPL